MAANLHVVLLFGKRLDTILLRHWIRKYPDSPVYMLSDSLRIYFLTLWRARFIRLMRVDGKKKNADSKITGRGPRLVSIVRA